MYITLRNDHADTFLVIFYIDFMLFNFTRVLELLNVYYIRAVTVVLRYTFYVVNLSLEIDDGILNSLRMKQLNAAIF